MREADHGALSFGPLGDWQSPTWPVFNLLGARIVLIFQSHQHEMATVARRKARYFEIVANERIARRDLVYLALKKALLIIVRRRPGEYFTDSERFATDVTGDLLGHDAFGRALVVHAARSV